MAKAMKPAFIDEDLDYHVDYIIKHDPIIAEYVKHNPLYRQDLLDVAKERYKTDKIYLRGNKIMDIGDALASVKGLMLDVAGPATAGAGTLAARAVELGELLPKALYLPFYAAGMNDYEAIPYFMAMELLSAIPIAGEAIDMLPLYTRRAQKVFRTHITEDFLAKVSRGKSRTNH